MVEAPNEPTPQEREHRLTVERIGRLHGEAFAAFLKGDLKKFVDTFREIRIQYHEEARYLEERGEEKSPRLDFLRSVLDDFWGTCRIRDEYQKGRWLSLVTNLEVYNALKEVDDSLGEGGSERRRLDQERRMAVEAVKEMLQRGKEE